MAEHTNRICHIPRVLYHWRNHKDSTSDHPESKDYAYRAGEAALNAHFLRTNITARAYRLAVPGCYTVNYRDSIPDGLCLITTRSISHRLLTDIRHAYPKLSVSYADTYTPDGINAAVKKTDGKYLFFLDPRIISFDIATPVKDALFERSNKTDARSALETDSLSSCPSLTDSAAGYLLQQLCAPLVRDDISSAFAVVYDKRKRVYSAGITLGIRKTFGRAFLKLMEGNIGYASRLLMDYAMAGSDLSCAMIKKDAYVTAGGLDASFDYRHACADLFLKMTKTTPGMHMFRPGCVARIDAPLWEKDEFHPHHASYSAKEFRRRWHNVIDAGDPAYNPNLTTANESGLPG